VLAGGVRLRGKGRQRGLGNAGSSGVAAASGKGRGLDFWWLRGVKATGRDDRMAANPPHPPFIRIQRRAVARHAREVFYYSFSCYYFQISELGHSLEMLQPVLHLHFACSGSESQSML
jgi:hypothetical protein